MSTAVKTATFLFARSHQSCYPGDTQTPSSKAHKISIARDRFSADAKRESVFMVGDSLSDIRAAKEASVTSIAVTWGHQSLEHLLRGDPDYMVHFPHDLMDVINK